MNPQRFSLEHELSNKLVCQATSYRRANSIEPPGAFKLSGCADSRNTAFQGLPSGPFDQGGDRRHARIRGVSSLRRVGNRCSFLCETPGAASGSLTPREGDSMNLVLFLLIGAVAGWLAGTIMKGKGFGAIGNLRLQQDAGSILHLSFMRPCRCSGSVYPGFWRAGVEDEAIAVVFPAHGIEQG